MTEAAAGTGRSDILRRADALIDLGRFPMALEALAPLIAGPGDAEALCRGARALIGLSRHEEAADMAGRAVAAAPDLEWAHRLRSAALVALAKDAAGGQRAALADEAREAARQSVRLAPGLPVTYRNAVTAEITAGDLAAASMALQRLLLLAPEDAESWNTAALLALAAHDPITAEQHARRAIELDPNSSEAWNNLGVAQQRSGRMKDAVSSYVQSARLDPGEELTRRNIARSGLLVLRMAALVALLPILLVPDLVAAYLAAVIAAWWIWRPGGARRDQAEALGVRVALRIDRMKVVSPRVQAVLTEVVPRVVTAGALLAGIAAVERATPVVGTATLVVAVAWLFYVSYRARRGRSGR